ncbi:MAG TPA: DNA polymerase domain-containing protein [Candidatus Angelobacter sp.]|nr:DNA polymerase domain-containing protein [Candidatus Angelobacter sp.]
MRRTFWLLDLNHETYEGKSSIWLWGITHEGKRILVVDNNYRAYFYLLPRKDQDPEELRKDLEAEKPHPSIENATIEKKKLLAEERVVLRVFCKDPEFLERAARDTLKKTGAEATYEEKLRLAIKYQYDYGIKPCQWYEVDTTASLIDPKEFSVQETLTANEHPRAITMDEPPRLGLLSFSLLSVSKTGAPSPMRDPIQIISWRTNKNTNDVIQTRADSDQNTIQKFSEDISKINPDFVLSFEGYSIYWPYLVKRANKTKTPLKVGRDGGPPHQSLYGHYSLIGRANVDLLNFADDLYDVKIKTIENVAKYLGIQLSEEKPIDETAYFDYWSKQDEKKILVKQVEEQTETILKIGLEAIDYVIQISALSGLPPDQVIAAAVGFRVDNYLMMETHNLGQLIPARTEQPIIPYKGAIVLEPKVGLHDDVASLDFSSMYPSLMIKYNISPDTLVTGKDEDAFEVPEVKHRFKKKPSGFYRIVLTKLIEARKTTKAELKRTARSDPRYPLLKAREKAVKVMTNAVYGYAGWAGARWYSKEVAESAAALGRETINRAISLAKSLGLTVFYGDTDSLFVNYDERLVQKFQAEIDRELGLEINLSEVYKRILFTEAKKKYAGLRTDGQIDVVGLEAVRGGWSNLAREVQNTVLRMVLEDSNPSRASAYVQDLTSNLKLKKLPLSSFIIWKTLTKPVGAYEVNAPHVEVAKKMAKDGWPVTAGDKVGFVITKKTGKLFQKAEPHYKETIEDLDYDYYVRNQIVPAAARILEILGVSEYNLLAPTSQASLSVGTKRG